MKEDAKTAITELRVDGGITANEYLMQFQSDIFDTPVLASHMEELSGIGVAILAGITIGLCPKDVQQQMNYKRYHPNMLNQLREDKKSGWKQAVLSIIKN